MDDEPFLFKKGKPFFSWAFLAGVVYVAVIGTKGYIALTAGQEDLGRRLQTNEAAVAEGTQAAKDTNVAIQGMASDISGLRGDVNASLTDRWTGTDMQFWGRDTALFWSELARLNPTLRLPTTGWPVPRRATVNDGGH